MKFFLLSLLAMPGVSALNLKPNRPPYSGKSDLSARATNDTSFDITCESVLALNVTPGCICDDVTYDGVEYVAIDCGFCTACNVSDIPDPPGETCNRYKDIGWHTKTQEGSMEEFIERLISVFGQGGEIVYAFILSDGSEYAFEVTYLEEFSTVFNESVYVYPEFSLNGVECALDTTQFLNESFALFTCELDCTAFPGIDVVADVCTVDISEILDIPILNLFAIDTFGWEEQCLDAMGAVVSSGTRGDPHIQTFDGLDYDCQAAGDFVLVKGSDGNLEVQGRFVQAAGASGQTSVMTGLAVMFGGDQMEMTITDESTCDATIGTAGGFSVETMADNYTISYDDSFLEIILLRRNSSSFGCFWTAAVGLPTEGGVTYMGLYGSPDDDPTNDWMMPDGTVITLPTDPDELLFETAYNYCTDNWCITVEADSMFSSGFDAAGCTAAYDNAIQTAVDGASDELKALCGDDVGCLVDGSLGDISDAQVAVEDAAQVEAFAEEFAELATDPEEAAEVIAEEQEAEEEEGGGKRCGLFCKLTCGPR